MAESGWRIVVEDGESMCGTEVVEAEVMAGKRMEGAVLSWWGREEREVVMSGVIRVGVKEVIVAQAWTNRT